MAETPDSAGYDEQPDVQAIDVALSGGGFRATLFHLGLVAFLQHKKLLGKVKNICSVSGGSVLAAHLVSYWHDYTGTDGQFRNRVKHTLP